MFNIPLIDQHEPIIVDGRRIQMPSGKDVAVRNDSMSQILTFHIDRYFDGVDLFTMECIIKYRNAAREYGMEPADVSVLSDDKLSVQWVIGPHVTATQGVVPYQIKFIGDSDPVYVWQTAMSQFTVLDSLQASATPIPPPDIIDDILTQIKTLKLAISEISKPNIIDNGDFRNLVNQRGLSEYIGTEGIIYTLDRWRVINATVRTLTIFGSFIRILRREPVANINMDQLIEFPNLYSGKQLTLGLMYRSTTDTIIELNVNVDQHRIQNVLPSNAEWVLRVFSVNIPSISVTSLSVRFGMPQTRSVVGDYIDVLAVKLEPGTVSTLPNDLSSPPPDLGRTLADCQRHQLVVRSGWGWLGSVVGSNNIFAPVVLPVPLRTSPTLIHEDALFVKVNGVEQQGFSFSLIARGMNSERFVLNATKSGHGLPIGSLAVIEMRDNSSVIFDANL